MTVLDDLQIQLNTVLAAAARGQRKGCTVCSLRGRGNSQDCNSCKSIKNLPIEQDIRASIALEQINIANQEEVSQDVESMNIDTQQNNNLRNALLLAGVLVII